MRKDVMKILGYLVVVGFLLNAVSTSVSGLEVPKSNMTKIEDQIYSSAIGGSSQFVFVLNAQSSNIKAYMYNSDTNTFIQVGGDVHHSPGDVVDYEVADVDGDEIQELLVLGDSKSIFLYKWNNWIQEFTKLELELDGSGWGGTPVAIDVADVDGNGISEVFIACTGGAAFSDKVYSYECSTSLNNFQLKDELSWSGEIFDIFSGDGLNDGSTQLMVAGWSSQLFVRVAHLRIYEWDGSGYSNTYTITDEYGFQTGIVGDSDNDGKNEIVMCTQNEMMIPIIQGGHSPKAVALNYDHTKDKFSSEHIDTLIQSVLYPDYKIHCVDIEDADNDGSNEVVIGTGSLDVDGQVYLYEYKKDFWGNWEYQKDSEIDPSPEEPVISIDVCDIYGSDMAVITGTETAGLGSSEAGVYQRSGSKWVQKHVIDSYFLSDIKKILCATIAEPVEITIVATSEENWYDIGEIAKVTIDVTNNRDEDTEIWLGITFQDPEENEYDIPLEHAGILRGGETKSFDVGWTIPNNAPLGQYRIAVNCWKDEAQTDKYTDNLELELTFNVYNLDILSPTPSSPVIVGDPSTPTEFNAEVSTGISQLLAFPGVFNAMIGSKPAGVTVIPSFFDNINGIYALQITPPAQDTEGSYDLDIWFNFGEVSDYDVELNAVIYSTGGNIDVVEVLDRSGSMGGEPIQVAKDSAKLFVDLMNTNDMVGVASYSRGASVNYGLTEITSDTIKQDAKTAIDGISAGGGTSIGAGLQAGYNELVNKGDPSHPHSIVLMSDGWHNTAPHPDTVLPDIRNANIRVFTIGLGAGADASLLSHIAHDSGCGGGEYYYSPGSGELSAIYNAIAGVVKAESTVKTVTGNVQQGETITHKVDIDPAIDVVTFTVTWTSGTLDLELERPDGSKVDPSDLDVISHTKEATYETYTMDSPMVGEWTMEITVPSTSSSAKTTTSDLANAVEGITANTDSSDDDWSTEIDVSAIIKSAQKAVTAQAGISYTATVTATTNLTVHIYTDKDQYSLNEPMRIITALTKAGSPVTGADVNVTIERPDGAKDYLSLYDDGKHDDGVALDGVYANYYTNTGMSGSYTLTVHASGTASPEEFTREVKKSVYVSGVSAGEISVTPKSWDTGIVHLGGDTISAFTVSSTSTKDEAVMISATDLTDGYGNGIGSENVIGMPSTFVVPAGGSGVFYERIYVPETAKTGNYAGSIVLTSTANSVNIPVTLEAKKLFETDLPNVELLYADPTVTNINVTRLNLSGINETYKPEECTTPQSAYMIDSTGSGNFTLRFTGISGADSILIYKIDPSSTPPDQWILLDATTTTDAVTFTMEVGDPPVVFCSCAPPSAASTTATGAPKYTYRTNENVYAAGSGFTPGTNVDIYVVPDQDWNDGDPIPQDVTGAVETVSVNNGDIGPVLVWNAPLAPGSYDIVIDANRNGVYNAATDGLDSGSPGFVVLASPPPTPPTDVPALTPAGIIALIGLLCVIGTFMIRRRFI